MSGISARIADFAIAKQSAKGTPASVPTLKYFFAGQASLAPVKDRGRLAMTDSGRDQGPGYTSGMRVEGDVPLYMHPDGMALPAAAFLGANADTGTTPNFTHTGTPANDGMWVTCWRHVGNAIFERYDDCKINTFAIAGTAGSPMTLTLGIMGIKSTFLASNPVLAALTSQPFIYPEAQGAIKLDTVAQAINSINFSGSNNFSPFQADDYFSADIDPGAREFSLSLGLRFTGATAVPDYRAFFYGSDVGTTLSPVVGTHAADITWTRNANLNFQLLLPQITYAGIPVQPDPGGDPISIDLSCAVEKPVGSAICTMITKDQAATI